MSQITNTAFIDLLISSQKKTIKNYFIFAGFILGLGIIIILSVFLLLNSKINETLKVIIVTGGTFISSISAFPIKEVISRKEKIDILEYTKNLAQDDRIDKFIWEKIKNNLSG